MIRNLNFIVRNTAIYLKANTENHKKKCLDFRKKYSALKNADKRSKYKASKDVRTMQYNITHSLHPEQEEK